MTAFFPNGFHAGRPSQGGPWGLTRPAKPALGKGRLLLLTVWIASLTVGLDMVNELKPFDLAALAGCLVFSGVMARWRLRHDRLLAWAIGFVGMVALGSLVTLFREIAFVGLAVILLRVYRLFGYVALFGIIRYLGLNPRQLRILLLAMLAAAVVQAVLIVLQQFEVVPLLWPEKELYYGTHCGPSGTLGVNHLNVVLFMSVAISCVVALWRGPGWRAVLLRPWLLATIPFMAAAVVYGRARSALLAAAVLALGAVRHAQGAVLVVLALLVTAVVGTRTVLQDNQAYSMVQEDFLDRWDSADGSVDDLYGLDAGRPLIWGRTLEALGRRIDVLLIGTGFQNFANLDPRSAAAHCLYLHVLVELGLAGLFVFLAWMRSLWFDLRAMERMPQPDAAAVGHAGTMCLLTLLVLGIFNESVYPARALPGAMGFCLAFFAIATHRGWLWGGPGLDRPAMAAAARRPIATASGFAHQVGSQ